MNFPNKRIYLDNCVFLVAICLTKYYQLSTQHQQLDDEESNIHSMVEQRNIWILMPTPYQKKRLFYKMMCPQGRQICNNLLTMSIAQRNRWVSIVLIVFNSLAFALCIGAGVYQFIGGRLGSLSSDANTTYMLGLVQVSQCATQGYAEVKYIALYYQLTLANIGLVVALLGLFVGLFFSVGLLGTTRDPAWKYCAVSIFRIKLVLYFMFGIATLLSGVFFGFVLAPYFYISSLNCLCPTALIFQVSLFIQFLLGGAAFLFSLLSLLFTFFIKADQKIQSSEKYLEKNTGDRNNTDVPMKSGREENLGEVLQFSMMMKNPMHKSQGREYKTMNYADIQMGNLREGVLSKEANPELEASREQNVLQKNTLSVPTQSNAGASRAPRAPMENAFSSRRSAVPQSQHEDLPAQIPAYDPYAPLDPAMINPPEQLTPLKSRRSRLETNSLAKQIALKSLETQSASKKSVNPFMNYTPELQEKSAVKSLLPLSRKQTPMSINMQKSQQSGKKKLKTHPKLESSMKNYPQFDDTQQDILSVFGNHLIPEVQHSVEDVRINQGPPAGEQADMTMALMAELNNINFADTNQMNGTYFAGAHDNSGHNGNMSIDMGVSQVLPHPGMGGRLQNVHPN